MRFHVFPLDLPLLSLTLLNPGGLARGDQRSLPPPTRTTTARGLKDWGTGSGRVIESRLVSQSATKQSREYQGKHTRHLETDLAHDKQQRGMLPFAVGDACCKHLLCDYYWEGGSSSEIIHPCWSLCWKVRGKKTTWRCCLFRPTWKHWNCATAEEGHLFFWFWRSQQQVQLP